MKGIVTGLLVFALFAASELSAGPGLDGLFDGFVARAALGSETPALVARVAICGDLVLGLDRAVGFADLRGRERASCDTLFRLASVSKPFTATAVMRQVELGAIDLDAPAQRYAPDVPWPEVTVRHLLNHTGGVPEYLSDPIFKSRPDNQDVLRALRRKKLEFVPGSAVCYRNTGYAALALVLEGAVGKDYGSVLREQIFAPSGMERTAVPRWDWTHLPGRATGYKRRLGLYVESDSDVFNGIVGDGGIYASAAELDRWLNALHGGKLLREDTMRASLEPPLPGPHSLRYGFGWVLTRIGNDTLVWHNGSWLGFDTFVGRLLRNRANIVLLSNAGLQGRGLDLADQLGFPLAERIVAAK
jgi:CubicO group peptidase (beta-lactamase class C family)